MEGPDELQQANYALRSLPEASGSSMWYPHLSLQWLWDWWAYMTQMPFITSMASPTAPSVGRRARMRGHLLTTC